jgi:hypothetical protein
MKTTLIITASILALVALIWALTANDLAMAKVFNPKFEQVRRETFEQSKSYRQGAIQELQNMQFQYEQASPEHKAALASIIMRRAADFQDLPSDIQSFVSSLKQTRSY